MSDYLAGYNTGPQPLYTIDLDQFNKTVYTSVGDTATINLVSGTSSGGNVSIIDAVGTIALADPGSYTITVATDTRNIQNPSEGRLRIINADTGAQIGPAVSMTSTLNTSVVTTGSIVNIQIQAVAPANTQWQYPQQLANSTATIQQLA